MEVNKTALFIGHRVCHGIEVNDIYPVIRELAENGVNTFLSGGCGYFDMISARAVWELKKEFSEIENILVIPYLNFNVFAPEIFDGTLYPEDVVTAPFRAKIIRRNRYMVKNSAYAVCYVNNLFGGSGLTYEYAKKQGLRIINLGGLE